MPYFALHYRVVADYVERRAPLRAEHLALAQAAAARGELILAGAFDPPDGALLVWRCADRAPIEAFVAADPYVRTGLVTSHEIRAWHVVVGAAVEA